MSYIELSSSLPYCMDGHVMLAVPMSVPEFERSQLAGAYVQVSCDSDLLVLENPRYLVRRICNFALTVSLPSLVQNGRDSKYCQFLERKKNMSS